MHAILARENWIVQDNSRSEHVCIDSQYMAELVHALVKNSGRDLLEQTYGACPPGLRGALAKLGPHAESQEFYQDLFDIFADPALTSTAKALGHLQKIDSTVLKVVQMLPEAWRLPALIEQLDDVRAVGNFFRVAQMIKRHCPEATDAEFDASIRHLNRGGMIGSFVESWLLRARFPVLPIASEHLRPIRTGRDLKEAARSMHNCMRKHYLADILAGTSTFLLIEKLPLPIVAHLHRANVHEDFVLEDIYGPKNITIPADIAGQAYAILGQHGIDPESRTHHPSSEADLVRNYLWAADNRRRAA